MDRICEDCAYFQPEMKCSENTVGYSGYGKCLNSRNSGRTAVSVCGTDLACRSGVMVDKTVRPLNKEPEPKKAYVIVSGEYSDYTVNAVFLDKEEAERAAETANRKGGRWYDDHRVLEFDIGVPCDLEKCDLYSAYFNKEGHVTHASKHAWLFSDEVNEVRKLNGPHRNHDYCIDVYATDEEHAKKIAADIFAKWKAEKEGIT